MHHILSMGRKFRAERRSTWKEEVEKQAWRNITTKVNADITLVLWSLELASGFFHDSFAYDFGGEESRPSVSRIQADLG